MMSQNLRCSVASCIIRFELVRMPLRKASSLALLSCSAWNQSASSVLHQWMLRILLLPLKRQYRHKRSSKVSLRHTRLFQSSANPLSNLFSIYPIFSSLFFRRIWLRFHMILSDIAYCHNQSCLSEQVRYKNLVLLKINKI